MPGFRCQSEEAKFFYLQGIQQKNQKGDDFHVVSFYLVYRRKVFHLNPAICHSHLVTFSERPLGRHRRDGIEAVVLAAVVPDEVVADFHLRTKREVHVLHAFQCVEVEPELRFRYHDQLAVHVRIVPDITEPAEGTEAMHKGCSPHLRQLEAL